MDWNEEFGMDLKLTDNIPTEKKKKKHLVGKTKFKLLKIFMLNQKCVSDAKRNFYRCKVINERG